MQRVVRYTLVGIYIIAGLTACADTTTAPRTLALDVRQKPEMDKTAGNHQTSGDACAITGDYFICHSAFAHDFLAVIWNDAYDKCRAGDASACADAWYIDIWNGHVPGGSGADARIKVDGTASGFVIVMYQGHDTFGERFKLVVSPNGLGNGLDR